MRDREFRRLAEFRELLRQFRSFSEGVARALGLTALQYETLLAIKAKDGIGPVTVKALAQGLSIKHNSAVGLVDRIEQLELVVRRHPPDDRRTVLVELTPRGRRILHRLANQHQRELERVSIDLVRHARAFTKAGTSGVSASIRRTF